jgi:hypothetical protein
MVFMPFLQKKEAADENNPLTGGKKIEFAQKLPVEDLEGTPSRKGESFDFLKGLEPRKEGEPMAVKMPDEQPAAAGGTKINPAEFDEEKKTEEMNKPESLFSRLFKPNDKDFSPTRRRGKSTNVLEVNLVKGEIVKFFDWQRGILLLLVSVFASAAVISLAYWGISSWGSSKQNTQNSTYLQDYYKVNKEIKDLEPQMNEVMKFKARLDSVNFLLARHIYWTNFFNFLEDNTLSNVYFSNFTGDINGSYVLSATTDSLDAIDAQIKKLLVNSDIMKTRVDSASVIGESGKPIVSFSLSFALAPKIFLK